MQDNKKAIGAINQITTGYTLNLIGGIAISIAAIFLMIFVIMAAFAGEISKSSISHENPYEIIAQILSASGIVLLLIVIILFGLLSLAGTIVQLIGLDKYKTVLDKTGTEAIKKLIMSIVFSLIQGFVSNIPYIGSFLALPIAIVSVIYYIQGYSNLRKSEVLMQSEKGRAGAELLYKSALYGLIGVLLIFTIIGILATFVLAVMSIINFFKGWKMIREMHEETPDYIEPQPVAVLRTRDENEYMPRTETPSDNFEREC